jgi:hypothetical protein
MNEDIVDNDTSINNMGYRDSSSSNNYSLSSNSSNNSQSESSSNDSHIIALTTLSDSEYETDSEEETEFYELGDYDENSEVEAIYQDDKDHLDADKNDGNYYVGIHKYISSSGNFLFVNSVSGSTFTKYSLDNIREYLHYYSIMLRTCSEVDIMQLYIRKEVYYVVVKTFWLRIIQRVWKKKYQQYVERQHKKTLPKNMRYREIHGKYPKELNYLPRIRGMLSQYNNKLT